MGAISDSSRRKAMYRRWIYMVIAIAAAAFLMTRPVFNFQEDKGIIYVRSFSMTQKDFIVTQTEIKTGVAEVTATSSVKGLYYCNKALLYGCILCLLCFFSGFWRIWACNITALIAGMYYLLMIYYAIDISGEHYATLYPNIYAFLPAISLQMIIMTRQNVIHYGHLLDEPNENEEQ